MLAIIFVSLIPTKMRLYSALLLIIMIYIISHHIISYHITSCYNYDFRSYFKKNITFTMHASAQLIINVTLSDFDGQSILAFLINIYETTNLFNIIIIIIQLRSQN